MSGVDLSQLMVAATGLEAARAIKALSGVPVPVARGEERVPLVQWSGSYDPANSELERLFAPEHNVAMIGGARSAGIIDIDLDHPNAVAFADILFADCPSFGRRSRPRSHRVIHCPGATTGKFQAPKAAAEHVAFKGAHGVCLAEIQADKKLITLPPSIHPCGEPYAWDGGVQVVPTWPVQRLSLYMGVLAFMCFFSAYYPPNGGRHDACLAATGVLVRTGLDGALADDLVRAAAQMNSDEEWRARGGGLSADDRLTRREPVSGLPALLAQLGVPKDWEGVLRGWLFPAEPDALIIDRSAPRDTAREFIQRRNTSSDGQTLLYAQDDFHRFESGVWRPLDPTECRGMLYEFMEEGEEKVRGGGVQRFRPNPGHVTSALDALKSLVLLRSSSPPTWLDGRESPPASEIIAFPNGLLHAPSMAFTSTTPQLFTLNQLPVVFDINAPMPTCFLGWLNSLWGDEPETISLLQEIVGLSLVPDTSFQKIFMLYGPPRAGKGVAVTLMQALLGQANYASPTLASLGDSFGVQPMIGKLMAFIPDARLDMTASRNGVTQTLLAVSGEDGLSVQRKFKLAWEGKLPVRFTITTNEIPQLRDDAGALTARFVPVVFRQSFQGQEDPGLKARLLAELPGILLWGLEGYRRLKRRGHFVLPVSSQDLIGRMTAVFSQLGTFIEDCLVCDDEAETPFSMLFATYQAWAETQGLRKTLTKSQFGERLNEQGFAIIQRRPEKVRMRRGVRLNADWAARIMR